MATTTSLKLPDELRARAASAARAQNMTPHAFMVQAIELAATAAEQRAGFIADALAARREALSSGKAHAADDVHDYLRERASGKAVSRPKAKPWQK